MNLRLSRYKFNAKIISDDPKLNVPHTHPLYTFSIHVCVSASFLLVFPIFSYSLRKSQPNMTVVIRVSREARRVAEGRRSSLACTDECRLDREIQREKVELGCVLERESRTLCQKEQGMMVGGRGRERERGARSSKRGTIDRYSSKQRGVPRIQTSSSAPCTTTPTLSAFFHPPHRSISLHL